MKKLLFSSLLLLFSAAVPAQVTSVQICDSVAWQDDYVKVLNEQWDFRDVPFETMQEGLFVQLRGGVYFTDSDGNYLDIDWDSGYSGWFEFDWASWGDNWAGWGKTSNAWQLQFKKCDAPAYYDFERGAYFVEWFPSISCVQLIYLDELSFDEPHAKTVSLHGKIAEITDMSKAMWINQFPVGDISNEKLQEGVFVQVNGDYWFADEKGNPISLTSVSTDKYDWSTWGDGSLAKYNEAPNGGDQFNYWLATTKKQTKFSTSEPKAVYFKYDITTNTLTEITLSSTLKTVVFPERPILHGDIAEITDLSRAMEDCFERGDIGYEKLYEGVFVQLFGDYWYADPYDTPLYPNFQKTDFYDWSMWGDGSLARYNQGLLSGQQDTYIMKSSAKQETFKPKRPEAAYFKFDPESQQLVVTILNDTLRALADPTKPMLRGNVALITDLSRAMDNCFTIGDICHEQLCEGVFVQVRGEYWLTDPDGLPLGKRWDSSESYDWATWGDGSLAKYYTQTADDYRMCTSNGQITYGGGYPEAVYFKFDTATQRLREIILREYLGPYDWHDFSLEGYVRTLEGTDPITGYYDAAKAFATDSLAYYYYDSSHPSEFGSVPLFFYENPYQVDGPCRLMYKGEPWSLKLDSIDIVDEAEAAACYCEPGTEKVWWYSTDEKGDTINLQAGVYIFFLNYYNQEEEPLSLSVMRCDIGRYSEVDEDLTPAEPYETTYDPVPTPSQETETLLTSYYTWETKEAKWKTRYKLTHVGEIETRTKYYVYHTNYSGTSKDYPLAGLGALLGHPECIAVIYTHFIQSTYENRKNYATFHYNGKGYAVTASRDQGTPVILFNPNTESITVVYLSSDQYHEIMTSIPSIDADMMDDAVYDLFGRRAVNPGEGIYIKNGKKIIIK